MKVDWVPLGEVLRLDQHPVDVVVTQKYPSCGVLNRGRGLFDKGITEGSDTSYTRLFRLSAGQIVYSKLFGWEGAVALVPAEFDGYFVSSEFPAFAPDPDRVAPGFLEHFLKSTQFTEDMARSTNGLGQRRQRVNIDAFLRILVPLPPTSDQDRIAAHLSSLDDRVAGLDSSAPHLMEQLPRLLGKLLNTAARGVTTVQSLCANRQVVIHPGDDLQGAEEFVGLEHIESHTGRRIGGRPIGDESGRKLLFGPGQVTYGYLRPYLNKVWAADRTGLCSVEQFTLTPAEDVDARLLSGVLRSEAVWRSAREATNNLQLPRLGVGALMAFQVPDVRGLDWEAVRPAVERLTTLAIRETELQRACARLQASILPAARNEIFSAMR